MLDIDTRVKLNQIIENQLPEFLRSDFPLAEDFLKTYYLSQDAQGSPGDILNNFDQYLKVDNLTSDVISGSATLNEPIDATATEITLSSENDPFPTEGYPAEYGLLRINDEIITYTSKTATTFSGCIRGFSGVTKYNVGVATYITSPNGDPTEFRNSVPTSHKIGATVTNLSVLFLQEFYKKLKKQFLPGFENVDFTNNLNVGNFFKHARSFYQSKGIEESVKILFRVLYGVDPIILDLEERLIKPSASEYIRREIVIAEPISGNPANLVGQTIYKSTDLSTNASVSEVEPLTREDKLYYKLSLFIGFSDRDLIEGTFTIPGKTKVLEDCPVGFSTISVDSTVGFGHTGTIISGTNSINYTSKSINQFYGCSGIEEAISVSSDIRSDEVIFGYEDGDTDHKTELRITGVLSDYEGLSDIALINENEDIFVKNVGESIENVDDPTYKEIFANSFIYNTSCRYQIESVNGSTFKLSSTIDKSSLKLGDSIEILERNSNTKVADVNITNLDSVNNSIIVSGLFTLNSLKEYDIRRKIKKVTSSGAELREGNNSYIGDVLNVYVDGEKDGYVASNSLPSYELDSTVRVNKNIIFAGTNTTYGPCDDDQSACSTCPCFRAPGLHNDDQVRQIGSSGQLIRIDSYQWLTLDDPSTFITGESIIYSSDEGSTDYPGLESGKVYYIEVQKSDKRKVRLYNSITQVGSDEDFIPIGVCNVTDSHTLTKETQYGKKLGSNKILRKFPLSQDLFVAGTDEVPSREIGILIDGVQIKTPISEDYMYYGPIESIDIYNGGEDYDVANPPKLVIQDSHNSGMNAYAEPVVTGSVKKVFVDPSKFDIDNVVSISIEGGNGGGCILEPIVRKRYRELNFDSRDTFFAGGISIENETITFTDNHNLETGETVYYSSNGHPEMGIGPAYDTTNTATGTLSNGAPYVIRKVNEKTVTLYNKYDDAIGVAGINTIGFSTSTKASGTHKFRTGLKSYLSDVKVIESGSGYTYKKVNVNPSGISTGHSKIDYNNHGFDDGDIIEYLPTVGLGTTVPKAIDGLDTTKIYKVLKLDEDSFRLADAGYANTISSVNYERREYVGLGSTGTGYQTFKYQDIKIKADITYTGITSETNLENYQYTFTPIVTGSITDVNIYEHGTKYGTTVLSHHKDPLVKLETGKEAELGLSVVDGQIADVQVLNKGKEYYSLPDIVVETTGITTTGIYGNGAVLRPVISDGRLTEVVVINPGIGYTAGQVNAYPVTRGKRGLLESRIKRHIIDNISRESNYGLDSITGDLNLSVIGYNQTIANAFGDDGTEHSPIIGWAYDGNPIYGPYGYTDSTKLGPIVGIVTSGYVLDTVGISSDYTNGLRPDSNEYPAGYFTTDWIYNGSGQLDKHNGRYCKTPEFPTGVYAYFAGVSTSVQTNQLVPRYPYFIGNSYRSPFISSNTTLTQEFDFNTSNLSRNTFPYKVNEQFANNDFIVESNEFLRQHSTVESVTTGLVDEIQVLDGGRDYKVGDFTVFDNEGTNGSGVRGLVKSISGIGVSSIETEVDKFENAVFIWESENEVSANYYPFIEVNNKDSVAISGLSSSIVGLTDSFSVGVKTDTIGLAKTMSYNNLVTGVVEDIYVNIIPKTVSIGSSLRINNDEIVQVLNKFDLGSILRVKRFGVGAAHSYSSRIDVLNTKITLPVRVKMFESDLNDKLFFNAKQSVGLGLTVGGGISVDYTVGETTTEVPIPTRAIYLPNHPFKTGEKLTFKKKGTASSLLVGESETSSNLFNLPDVTSNTFDVYAINKGQNYVGLVTVVGAASTSEGLFFHGNGSDDFEYSLETKNHQVIGDIDKIVSTITTKIGAADTTTHNIQTGDIVSLNVIPNTVVGLGSTAPLTLSFNEEFQKLVINEISFANSDINTSNSTITINNHGYKTGDRVLYGSTQPATAKEVFSNSIEDLNGCYFVNEVDSNTLQLGKTLSDVKTDPPQLIDLKTTGGAVHTFGLVNPQIEVVKKSRLTFGVGSSTLNGYDLKFYYDQEFKNEFVSVGVGETFNVISNGAIGIGSTATKSVAFTNSTPSRLYYSLSKGGYISTADTLVENNSEIKFINSEYNGDYKVLGITSDTFQISPYSVPSVLTYKEDQCEVMEYSTESKTVSGPINEIKVISKGFNYKSLPKFSYVGSDAGQNANIVALSTSIGRINELRIVDIGYEYASDKTLSPEAFVPPIIRIDNLDTVKEVKVVDGGKEYLSPPDIVVYDPDTDKIVDKTSLVAKTPNQSISEVEVIAPIQGLNSVNHRIVSINNSNGVGINSMTGGGTGIVTCVLNTPIDGFAVPPFSIGDDIFVEGIELFGEAGIGTQSNAGSGISTEGDGYNSANYQYRFFKVDDFINTNPAILKYNLIGLTTNPGIAKTFQSGYANIVNRSKYPVLESIQERGKYVINESLYILFNDQFVKRDLKVVDVRDDYIKIDGKYELKIGDRIKGSVSDVTSSVIGITENKARFKVNYSNRQDLGWVDDVGKIGEDHQVLPNNDYYQNLSYSVKSSIAWDSFVDVLNRTVHPAGLKNFADVSIGSTVNVSASYGATTNNVVILDVLNEKRVDTINNYDLALDYDARDNKSKFIQFENKKLTDFTKCKTNRVLIHDDISPLFSSKGVQDLFTEIEEVTSNYSKYLIQIVDPDTFDVQISDLVVLTSTNNAYLIEKTSDYTNMKLGEFSAESDSFNRKTLRFDPTEKYDKDHDIKILKTTFNTTVESVGTKSIGSIDLLNKNVGIGTTTIGFTTTTIAEFDVNDFNGFSANVLLQDDITKELSYNEVIVDFDGTNTYYSEVYSDSLTFSYSSSNIGVLTAKYDSGKVYFNCENETIRKINVNASIVGFGTTTAGIGTYRYAVPGQPPGAERSARLESTYNTGTSIPIPVTTINKNWDSSVKSMVRVSTVGNSAIHELVVLQDEGQATTIQYPYTGASSTGIGTFGAVTSGSDVTINFYPDAGQTNLIEVQSYNEIFYTPNDFRNEAPDLVIGPVDKKLFLSSYDGVNGSRANKIFFDLEHENTPIYHKIFNPADSTQLDLATGTFTLPNHFFNTNEELTYIPQSTFIGIGATAVSIGTTEINSGVTTDIMPSTVYAKVISESKFQLFSKKEYITAGAAITFTGVGEGNAHLIEMGDKLSKTVIGLDGIVQQPISFTAINHTLDANIGAATSQFVLSGISSIQPRDVLKVDNEYMKVEQVGFSSLPEGTINDSTDVALGISTLPVVRVRRGSLGIGATPHNSAATARVHRGSFNIVDSTVWFLDPPKGNTRERRSITNLPYVRAEFSGRTFLRQNYDTNMVFDDISDQFTGIGRTYTLTRNGSNVLTGVSSAIGNGILFINGVFQTPLTVNNAGNNYEFTADTNVGITSVVFTGISSANGEMMQSEFDINQNQLPRGGLIVSMGSTPGLGYAPLVGAKTKLDLTNNSNLFAAGSISNVVGVGTSSKYTLGIQTAAYDFKTGIITVTTNNVHGFDLAYPKTVKLKGLEFACPTNVVGTPTGNTQYDPSTGNLTIEIADHGLTNGDAIKLDKESITFSCGFGGASGSAAEKAYPRETDPAYDKYLTVSDVTTDTFRVNVLLGTTPTNTDAHTFVSADNNCVRTLNYVGLTTTIFQDHERPLNLTGIVSERTFEVNAGICTINHIFQNSPNAYAYEFYGDLTAGSGYRSPVAVGVTDIEFAHKFVTSASNAITADNSDQYTPTAANYDSATGDLVLTVDHNLKAATKHTVETASYVASTGVLTVTITDHGFSNNDWIKLDDHSISFTCDMDGDASVHSYPRPSDPYSGKWLQVANKTNDTFELNVGSSPEVQFTPSYAKYDPVTGLMELTIGSHTLSPGTSVKLATNSIGFTCDVDNNTTTKTYPRSSDPYNNTAIKIQSVTSTTITVQVLSTQPSTNITKHTFVSANPNAVTTGGNYTHDFDSSTPSGLSRAENTVQITTDSLTFTCDRDDHLGKHTYPRSTDPAAGATIGVAATTNTTITINVGSGGGGGTGAVVTANVAPNRHKFVSATAGAAFTGGNYIHIFAAGSENNNCVSIDSWSGSKLTPTAATYNALTGNMVLTVGAGHGITAGSNTVGIATNSITFTCDRDNHATEHTYPRHTDPIHNNASVAVASTTTDSITVFVGKSPIVTRNVTDTDYNPATGELTVTSSSHGFVGYSTITPTNAAYAPSTGVLTLTKNAHGFQVGDKILIQDNSISFTCTKDGNVSIHHYPRPSDYASGRWLTITNRTVNTFKVNVNPNPSSEQYPHTLAGILNGCIAKANQTVGIATGSLVMTCEHDLHRTLHEYPRITDPAHSVELPVGRVTPDTFSVQVGKSPAGTGGALEFTINDGGARYVNPELQIPQPIYENVPVEGVSRLGIGLTTATGKNLLLNMGVGAASTSVGVARSMFEISDFAIARQGHSFKIGDKFRPIGLVTDKRLQKPLDPFELEVVEVFNDYFAAWQFGEMDFIDSIAPIQDGYRKRFPLFFNGQLLSFEKDETAVLSSQIDLNAVLLIFVNGVLQTPNISYQFQGGTTFTFTEAPLDSDKVDIFFFLGQLGVDIEIVDISETIKPGDDLRIRQHPKYLNDKNPPVTVTQESDRILKELLSSDLVETTIYTGPGINEDIPKPLDWTKQKVDKWIKGDLVSKARESIEPQVYPTARIIGDITPTTGTIGGLDDGIFVDDSEAFFYEEGPLHIPAQDRYGITITSVDALITPPHTNQVAAGFTATITDSIVTSITTTNVGSGYTDGTYNLKFSSPQEVGVGVGTTAIGTATITNGSVASTQIVNAGFGYTHSASPQVIISRSEYDTEKVTKIQNSLGFTGIVTGITTTAGTNGHPLAIKFYFYADKNATDLKVGYPVLIKDTPFTLSGINTSGDHIPFNDGSIQTDNNRWTAAHSGFAVTSVDNNDNEVVSIGSTNLDNIYKVSSIYVLDQRAEITCNIHSGSDVITGFAVTGYYDGPTGNAGLTTSFGKLSWGRLSGITRSSSPISIGVTGLTVDSGLSTFPTIQRRNYDKSSLKGLRNTGAIRIQI